MAFALIPAAVAGLVGGIVMAGARMAVRAGGADLKMDVTLMWASMLRMRGTRGRLVGMAIHLVMSVLIAFLYAWGFQLLGITDNAWVWGVLGGVLHWVLAGLFLAMVPPIHPEVPERRPAPGMFVSNFGSSDVAAFLVGHLLYGLVSGVTYAWLHPAAGLPAAF